MTSRIVPPVPLAEQDFWRRDASCYWVIEDTPDMANAWVDENHDSDIYAVQVCTVCPVRQACVLDALHDPEAEGLRGGFFFTSGGVSTSDAAKLRREFGVRVRTRARTTRVAQPRISLYERMSMADAATDVL